MTEMTHPTAAVVVVTYNRPAHVRTCLEHLAQQTCPPLETVVVDASPDRRTADVVAEFPGVRFLRNDLGMGYMATSRAIGVAATIADVVAFIDDDAYAEPDWIERLLLPYADPRVGAVGGRARNGNSGEESEGADQVGLLLPDGTLTGFFAAITPGDIEVDHLIGCNMSYRRRALQAIGGIHDHCRARAFGRTRTRASGCVGQGIGSSTRRRPSCFTSGALTPKDDVSTSGTPSTAPATTSCCSTMPSARTHPRPGNTGTPSACRPWTKSGMPWMRCATPNDPPRARRAARPTASAGPR